MTRGSKKILMLTHEFPPMQGGISRYASELATSAVTLGHEVTVIAPDSYADCSGIDSSSPYAVRRFRAAAYGPKELPSLFRRASRIDTSNFDIVHAVDPSFVMALAFVRHFRKVEYQATVYGTDILGLRTSIQATLTGTRRMYERPARLIAISDFTRTMLLDKCPHVDSNKVDVSPLGVSRYWFEAADADNVREQFDIPKTNDLLLTVSRLDSRKGHRTMLNALRALPSELKSKLTYAIVGTASDELYHQEILKLAAECGADVRFLGRLSDRDLRALYASATLFCMPGEPDPHKIEGFGLVYLEAAAQGLPSLASSIGAVPEVVLDNQTGWLVEPANTDAVTQRLIQLLGNKPMLRQVGQLARSRAMEYTWEKCARLTYGEAA
ncbi:MAG: glycosyltransferase family 4 protein [bacterium]|nr:glycosyltransferase family 4 protein [bacterium]